MNRGNSSEIKVRRKSNFKPIMLTSKSIKPIQRADLDQVQFQEMYQATPKYQTKKRLSYHYAVQNNFLKRSQMIKKLTEEYREELMKNLKDESSPHRNNQHDNSPQIAQMRFKSTQLHQKGHDKTTSLLSIVHDSQTFKEQRNKKKFNSTAKAYQNFFGASKTRMNPSLGFSHLVKNHSKSLKDKWSVSLDKSYLHVRKISQLNHESHPAQQPMPSYNINQIVQKVSEFEKDLTRKMRHKSRMNSSCTEQFLNISENKSQQKFQRSQHRCRIQEDILAKRTSCRKQHFVFSMSDNTKVSCEALNKQKFQSYKDFLWKINYSNRLYVSLKDEIEIPYKFYVGPGNNGMLIKGIMRRRFWWQIIESPNEEANFIWTQIKINDFFKFQKTNSNKQKSKKFLPINQSDSPAKLRKIQSAFQCKQMPAESSKLMNKKFSQNIQAFTSETADPTPQFHSSGNSKIFKGRDYQIWVNHFKHCKKYEQKQQGFLQRRIKTMVRKKQLIFIDDSKQLKIQNHFKSNYFLGNKKALFYSLKKYYLLLNKDPFKYIPLTFHISKSIQDPEYKKFMQKYQEFQQKKQANQCQNIWIVKPGEMTNRGRGITVCSTLDDVKVRLKSKQKAKNGQPHTYIVQKYIEKPLLYNRRKFDIRHYMLMTCVNGKFKGYWYEQGYLRTTSFEYNIKNCKDLYTHLTNDAIQKYSADYGKFQKGNKVSYQDFQKYLNINYLPKGKKSQQCDQKYDFYASVLPKMKNLATDAIRATYSLLSPQRYEHNFELFGLDFMLDEDMNLYLIQVNTNPCLQTSCPLLNRIIPGLIENVFKVCVDPLFPPPHQWSTQRKMQMGENPLEQNKFHIVFDEESDGEQLVNLFRNSREECSMGQIDEEDEVYEDQGKQWVED